MIRAISNQRSAISPAEAGSPSRLWRDLRWGALRLRSGIPQDKYGNYVPPAEAGSPLRSDKCGDDMLRDPHFLILSYTRL